MLSSALVPLALFALIGIMARVPSRHVNERDVTKTATIGTQVDESRRRSAANLLSKA